MDKPVADFEKILHDAGMPVTEAQIQDSFMTLVRAEGVVTNTSRMSPFWRLVLSLITTPVLWIKDALIQAVLTNMFVATAGGAALRLLAWGLNLTPRPATTALGLITFISQDSTQAVTVPAGTTVQTATLNGRVYSVVVTQDTVIPAGSASGRVPVRAEAAGADWNLAPGYFRILPASVPGIDSALNEDDWLTSPGTDEESDDELRERCRNQFNLVGEYHTDAVYRGMIAAESGLPVDRIYIEHGAPRGPGTANAWLLFDAGQASAALLARINAYIMADGHHGHGDDLLCQAMPETLHDLTVTLYVINAANLTPAREDALRQGVTDMVRCAFRENNDYEVIRTWPWSRFSFSQLGRELHETFTGIDSLVFSLPDIISQLNVPRLKSLTVEIKNA